MLPQRKKSPVPAPVPEGACSRRCPDHRSFICGWTQDCLCPGMCRARRAAGRAPCVKCAVPDGGPAPRLAVKRFLARRAAQQEEQDV